MNTLIIYMVIIFQTAIRKKLDKASKTSDCADLKAWTPSICNHLYWSAVSTPPDQGDLIAAKWRSVVDHIQNHHTGFGGLFEECCHGELDGKEAKKLWLKPSKIQFYSRS